jgi:hypothetical protein
MKAPHVQHPTPEELAAFAVGKVDDAKSQSIVSHLEDCADCRRLAESIPGDSFVARLKEARRGDTSEPPRFNTTLPSILPKEKPAGQGTEVPARLDLPPELAHHPRYRILRELGRGGMGVVYKAEQTLMSRLVAIKVIARSLLERPEALERFQREVKAAARLNHPSIVIAHDAEQAGDLHMLVMEYVEGQSLAQVLQRKGTLPIAYACHFVRQAAEGLQHAFEQGMVHRDIKPQNLMVTAKGKVKILDFGLAKLVSEQTQGTGLTAANAYMGTPDYSAPEQASDARSADIRADIYSLGCTLYCLLAGRPPFQEGTAVKTILAHMAKSPPPLPELHPEVPPELWSVVERMLAKNPDQRYQKPKEIAETLAPFCKFSKEAPPQEAERVHTLSKAPALPVWKKPRWWLAGAALLLGVVVWLFSSGIFVRTKDGTIVLENVPAGAEVIVDGAAMALKTRDGKTIEIGVAPGKKHQLQVKKEGFKVFAKEIEIDAGGREPILVRLDPNLDTAEQKGFVSLFNGKDLTGWVVDSGERDAWRVTDGKLVAQGTQADDLLHQGYLLTERVYADFILRFEFQQMQSLHATSGVALRAVPGETDRDSTPNGINFPFHLTVWLGEHASIEQGRTGALWWVPEMGEPPVRLPDQVADLKQAGDWNAVEIEMRGQSLRVAVNGRDIQNVRLNQHAPLLKHPAIGLNRFAGRLGFLKRQGEARFRHIEIQELSEVKGAAKEPVVLAILFHRARGVPPREIRLYSSGHIDSPHNADTWEMHGNQLIFRWPSRFARGGVWIDTCTISADGRTYSGENQDRAPISGENRSGGDLRDLLRKADK